MRTVNYLSIRLRLSGLNFKHSIWGLVLVFSCIELSYWPSIIHAKDIKVNNDSKKALAFNIPPDRIKKVGMKIWMNECAGTIDGLTSWNKGEEFPSLGIGHFIWYPKPDIAPFKESFYDLVMYLAEHGVKVPAWIIKNRYCPWKTRDEFLADQNSVRMKELRNLLVSTIDLQCNFIARRLVESLPQMLASIPDSQRRQLVHDRFFELFNTSEGLYALMDYVNFKGEGTSAKERYAGQGWGMLQVLENMNGHPKGLAAVREFALSAIKVLERRVKNAPPERKKHEERWLEAWKKRVLSYTVPDLQ